MKLRLQNKFLNRTRAGNSPRNGRKPNIKSINWSSSQTLNIPNSPLATRKNHSDQNNSAHNSPVLPRNERLRTRSFSDDRSSETVPLFTMNPNHQDGEEAAETEGLLTEPRSEKLKLESAVL